MQPNSSSLCTEQGTVPSVTRMNHLQPSSPSKELDRTGPFDQQDGNASLKLSFCAGPLLLLHKSCMFHEDKHIWRQGGASRVNCPSQEAKTRCCVEGLSTWP